MYNIKDYKIAIASYHRKDILGVHTLKYLQYCAIDPKKIFIFVANQEEKKAYEDFLPKYYNQIVVAMKGLKNVRLFIRDYFGEGEYFVSFDDDIEYLLKKDNNRGKPIVDLNNFITYSFTMANSNACRLWGIGSHSNNFFLRDGCTIGLRYIIGTFYGLKNTHDKNTYIEAEQKEGAHRSILFYLNDGRVMKINSVGMKTKFFKTKGGLKDIFGEKRINNRLKLAGQWLIDRYPDLVYFKKNSKRFDIALRMLKPLKQKCHRWW